MAKYLISVWPFIGHIFPAMALAQALKARGHTVAFYTGALAAPLLEQERLNYFPFKELDGEAVERLVAPGYFTASPWRRVQRQKAIYRAWLIETLPAQLADLESVLSTWQPDAIISDLTMWAPILVLHETHRLPVAVFAMQIASMLPGPDVPPAGLGLVKPRTWRARLLTRTIGSLVRLFAHDVRRAANDLRRSRGLPPIACTVTEYAGAMPLYLITSAPELDFERQDLPPDAHYIGPCLWHESDQEPLPTWLRDGQSEQPWIYVTEGTIRDQAPIILTAAAKGLADLPAQVIMTTGGRRAPATLGLEPLSPNIRVECWLPDGKLIPRVAAVVTAGGAGTVLTALCAGVPLVIVPTEWDKPDSARRVEATGAGLRLAPRDCTPRSLRAAVERVLSEPSFRHNARRIGESLARCGGPDRGAELLERLVADA